MVMKVLEKVTKSYLALSARKLREKRRRNREVRIKDGGFKKLEMNSIYVGESLLDNYANSVTSKNLSDSLRVLHM
jgi:hypothetical protein